VEGQAGAAVLVVEAAEAYRASVVVGSAEVVGSVEVVV
jgi:hypothetical protein